MESIETTIKVTSTDYDKANKFANKKVKQGFLISSVSTAPNPIYHRLCTIELTKIEKL